MFNKIKSLFRLAFKSRLLVAGIIMTGLFSILLWRMFHLQILKGEKYQDNYTLKIVKERTLNSTRGSIYDRNGELLAYNELAYSVTIEDNGTYESTSKKNEQLNAEIAKIIRALEKNGDDITNNFKISYEDGTYSFNVTGTSKNRFLADVYGATSYEKLKYDEDLGYDPSQATEEQVMDYLMHSKNRFGVSDEYEEELAYKITVIRYAMFENGYQKYIATTIATNISEESVAFIAENSSELQGVEVIDDTIRKYNNSKYFASIIGYTGMISSDEYAQLSETNSNYTLNDVIGKAGIEQVMDAELQGAKGYEKLYVDYLGKAVEIIQREEPTAGNDVYLSIDAKLQVASYDLLEQEIAGIVYSNIENPYSDINIPITDVYFALINNNVIDISHFSEADASVYEKEVQQIFSNRQSTVLSTIMAELTGPNAKAFGIMNDEEQDYYTYIIKMLKADEILDTESIDTSDEVYQEWQNGEISPQEYLGHAISKNWIDITQFTIEEKYSDSTEIYAALCEYIKERISSEPDFAKIIYKYLVQGGSISGKQLCLILFDQGVLAHNAEQITALENNSVNALNFIKEKIKNIEITPAQLALDPCSGSCVITDVDTGEILALVSYPGYDNNRLANTVDAAYYASLQKDLSNPFYNNATQQRTAPGSTFKMLSSVAGLAEGVITTTTTIDDLGVYDNISNKPKCWVYPSNHGILNVSEALRDSCNYFYYELGYRLSTNNYLLNYSDSLGTEKIQKYAEMFGLNEKTGIEIEENTPQIADEYPVMAAIGQSNHNYATVQLSRYVTAIANGGDVYNYTLLNKICDSDGNVVKTYEPTIRNTVDVLDSSQWQAIHTGMRMVVENSSSFTDFPISAAGKTGTAQENLKRANHALFVGYAPYENPEISIATRIAFGYTSHNASDYARNVLAYYFDVENEEDLLNGQAEEVDGTTNAISD